MRINVLFVAALVGALAGCSLAFNGSRYQGGNGSDSGNAVDSATMFDSGMPNDAAMPPFDVGHDAGTDAGPVSCTGPGDCGFGLFCDSTDTMTCLPGCDNDGDCAPPNTACDISANICFDPGCSADSGCAMDEFCSATLCLPCDGDADHFYSRDATALRCSRAGHMQGGDCDDTDPLTYPYARVICSTPTHESCDMPMVPPIAMTTFSEAGLSPTFTLFMDGSGYAIRGSDIGMTLGTDQPALLDSAGVHRIGGFVAVGLDRGSGSSMLAGLQFALSGPTASPIDLFHDFMFDGFALGHTSDPSGNDDLSLAIVSNTTDNRVAFGSTRISGSGDWMGVTVGTLPSGTGFLRGSGVFPLRTGVADGLSGAIGVATVQPATGAPMISSFSPASGVMTGPANVVPGTWFASAGSMVMWLANDSQLALWNGTENDGISPPTLDFSAYVDHTSSVQQVLSPAFRGSLGVAIEHDPSGGGIRAEHFVAAIPVGNTAHPPANARLVLARWTTGHPTDPAVMTSAGGIQLHRLDTGIEFHAEAGVSIFTIDVAHSIVAYRDGSDVVARFISTPMVDPTTPEMPETIPMIHLGLGESVRGLVITGGAFIGDPLNPGVGIGRIGVAAIIDHATGPAEIRVRAIEVCVTAP